MRHRVAEQCPASATAAGDASENHGVRGAVLFIIDQLCALGGAERVLVRMAHGLPGFGYYPHVLTFAIDESLGFRDLVRCPLHVWPLSRTYDWNAFLAARHIRTLIRRHDIRITHTFHETSDLWAGMIAKLCGCPILISSRRDMGFQRSAKHKLAYRSLRGCFDEVQTVSNEVRQFCIDHDGLEPSRTRTVYNGVTLAAPDPELSKATSRERFHLPVTGPLVVSVGHLRRIKGFDILLRIAAEVIRVNPTVTFAIAGRGNEPEYAEYLQQLSVQLGVTSAVVFLGDVEDVPTLLRAADLFCLPSRSEGLSNALLEAMACQLPCVASRVGGNPEVIRHGRTGYLFNSEDHRAAAQDILRLIDDETLSRDMGRAGCSLVTEQFSTERMLATVAASYDRLLCDDHRID